MAKHKKEVVLLVSVLLSLMIAAASLHKMAVAPLTGENRPTAVTEDQYAAWEWLEEHTNEQEEILFLYGDGYVQSTVAVKRLHGKVSVQDMKRLILTNFSDPTITPVLDRKVIEVMKVWDGFRIRSIEQEVTEKLQHWENRSLCDFDYYVLDRYSDRQNAPSYALLKHMANPLTFNKLFLTRALQRGAGEMVYMNDQVVIVQNKQKGGSCV